MRHMFDREKATAESHPYIVVRRTWSSKIGGHTDIVNCFKTRLARDLFTRDRFAGAPLYYVNLRVKR